jgi:hypothetical protein
MMWASASYCQCTDVYGKSITCPDFDDSLVIYNNSLKVYEFYDNNPQYMKVSSREVVNSQEKKEVFDDMQKSRRLFYVLRQDAGSKSKSDQKAINESGYNYNVVSYSQYYQVVDDYRFYQRELENQILNTDAPMPIYDNRIAPVVVNEYKCVDTSSVYYGDIVNIPMYIPVVVKPVSLLTPSEMSIRNEILHIEIKPIKVITEKVVEKTDSSKASKVYAEPGELNTGSAVFLYNSSGSGSIIGFMKNGRFRKLRREEYAQFAVLKYAQDFLEDDARVEKWVKGKYGDVMYVSK